MSLHEHSFKVFRRRSQFFAVDSESKLATLYTRTGASCSGIRGIPLNGLSAGPRITVIQHSSEL